MRYLYEIQNSWRKLLYSCIGFAYHLILDVYLLVGWFQILLTMKDMSTFLCKLKLCFTTICLHTWCVCRKSPNFVRFLELSFNSSWLLVGSRLFCLQNFPCLVSFRCMCWRLCGGLNKEHSKSVHWGSNSLATHADPQVPSNRCIISNEDILWSKVFH